MPGKSPNLGWHIRYRQSFCSLFMVALMALWGGCGTNLEHEKQCVSQCVDRQCGEDNCGGICGTCGAGELCTPDGRCALELPDDPASCEHSCSSLGKVCGEHCGEICGECSGAQDGCVDGQCVCQPDCRTKSCGEGDGCGGLCEPCPTDISCQDCPLVLEVVETRRDSEGDVRYVVVAVDYKAPVGSELPGLADLRFDFSGPAKVVSVATGSVLNVQGARLFADPGTGQYYRVLPEKTLQLLLKPGQPNAALPSGRWLFVEFELGDDEGPAKVPFTLKVVSRKQTFAPVDADAALWSGGYSNPVVVWPWMNDED